ncbi:MAG: GNAT family protein [Bdellovibrionota bacterium]
MEIRFGEWRIRSFARGDARSLAAYANNADVAKYLRDTFPHPYKESDAKAWIRLASNELPETNFAIASRQEPIGGIGLLFGRDVFRRNAELGYWLGEPYWGRGIATQAVAAFVDYAFEVFDIGKLTAGVFDGNVASQRVLEKNGFVLEGRFRQHLIKNGELKDYLVFSLLKADRAPSGPRHSS